MIKNLPQKIALGAVVLGAMAFMPVVFAQTAPTQYANAIQGTHNWQPKPGMAFGQITAINGSTLTVQGKNGTTYTVDATSATVTVSGQTSSLSALAVGQQVMVQGQPSATDSTQITAQTVREGMMKGMKGMRRSGKGSTSSFSSSSSSSSSSGTKRVRTPMFSEVLTVTSINGTSIVATDSNGTTYTVDLSNAKIVRKFGGASSALEISVGDSVRVYGPEQQGSTSIVATNARDMSIQENSTTVGTLESVTANGFTLQDNSNNTYTVNVTSSTVYKTNLGQQFQVNGVSDLMVGDSIRVFGVLDTRSKTDTANAVRLLQRGTVTSATTTAAPIQQ